MRQEKTKKMLNYWMDLFAQTGPMKQNASQRIWPDRSSVQPSDCRDLLSHMFILEKSRVTTSYRLAGTKLCSIFGRELKNEMFDSLYVQSDKASIKEWTTRLGLDDYLLLITSSGETTLQKEINMETLLLPLSNNGTAGNRLLGITVPSETPQWLGAEPIVLQSIRSIRILRPWEETNNQQQRFSAPSMSSPAMSTPAFAHPFSQAQTQAPDSSVTSNLLIPPLQASQHEIMSSIIPSFNQKGPHNPQVVETLDSSEKVAHLTIIKGGKVSQ